MICTIKLIHSFTSLEEMENAVNFMKDKHDSKLHLEDGYKTLESGKWFLSYKSDGIEIWMNLYYISLRVSLWKYFLGNNLGTFDEDEIYKAVEKLQSQFPLINWFKSKVKVLHLGLNFTTSKPADVYIERIYGTNSMVWESHNNNGNSKAVGSKENYILFYNKAKEKDRKSKANILRIEYRIESSYWMNKYFNDTHPPLEEVISDLPRLHNIWYNKYLEISKDYSPVITEIKSMDDLRHLLVVKYGYENCEQLINNSYKADCITKNQRDYYIRNIRNMRNNGKRFTDDFSPMKELDDIVNYCLYHYYEYYQDIGK